MQAQGLSVTVQWDWAPRGIRGAQGSLGQAPLHQAAVGPSKSLQVSRFRCLIIN